MQTDYCYMNDMIYQLSDEVRLMFHTVASYNNGLKTFSNYNEYKLNGKNESNTMIKRVLSYYLFFEDRREKLEKISIYPENMFELLGYFEYIKLNWIDNDTHAVYGFLDNSLSIVNYDEYIYMRLPMDKIIKFTPGVIKTNNGGVKCIDMYLNSQEPVQVAHSTFQGMYYVLKNFDMLNYANTSLSFMMLMNAPINRTDFSSSGQSNSVPLRDNSTASGSVGRKFSNNKSAFFDD